MKKLYNTEDRRVLKQKLEEDTEPRLTVSFYKYWHIGNPSLFRDYLFIHWEKMGVMGRTYVAHEGINAQVSIPEKNVGAFKEQLNSISFLNGVRLNVAVQDDGKSFIKLKIKERKKIVADGIEDSSFNPSDTGVHLDAAAFNKLTDDNKTILVDMRNHYESEVGHFENAILPDADTFREEIGLVEKMLAGKEDRNIVMYCTGGIRCEKASAYLKHKGFPNVHQLEGGIIKYASDAKKNNLPNKFKGVNFVFDERLSERISDDIVSHCHQCGKSGDTHINCANEGCHLLFIQCGECRGKFDSCCSAECQAIVHMPEEQQLELRKGKPAGRNIFRKGRTSSLRFGHLSARIDSPDA